MNKWGARSHYSVVLWWSKVNNFQWELNTFSKKLYPGSNLIGIWVLFRKSSGFMEKFVCLYTYRDGDGSIVCYAVFFEKQTIFVSITGRRNRMEVFWNGMKDRSKTRFPSFSFSFHNPNDRGQSTIFDILKF